MLKCREVEVAERVIGKKFKLKKYHLKLTKYYSGGARCFIVNSTRGYKDIDIARVIINSKDIVPKDFKMYIAVEEYRDIQGLRFLVIFNRSPGCY